MYSEKVESIMLVTKNTIEKLKNRDEVTFEQIYYEYEKLVYYICYSITGNKQASEDLTQDTFVKLLTSLDNYQEKGKFKQYLMQIARNLSINYVTRTKEKLPVLDDEIVSSAKQSSNTQKMIIQINDALDFDEADIVILKIVYNFKFKEIAEYKNLTIGSVQSTYYQALEKLRKEFGK